MALDESKSANPASWVRGFMRARLPASLSSRLLEEVEEEDLGLALPLEAPPVLQAPPGSVPFEELPGLARRVMQVAAVSDRDRGEWKRLPESWAPEGAEAVRALQDMVVLLLSSLGIAAAAFGLACLVASDEVIGSDNNVGFVGSPIYFFFITHTFLVVVLLPALFTDASWIVGLVCLNGLMCGVVLTYSDARRIVATFEPLVVFFDACIVLGLGVAGLAALRSKELSSTALELSQTDWGPVEAMLVLSAEAPHKMKTKAIDNGGGANATKKEEAKEAKEEEAEEFQECSICQQPMKGGRDQELGYTATMTCGHSYHHTCIKVWLESGNRSCPICRERQDCFKPLPTSNPGGARSGGGGRGGAFFRRFFSDERGRQALQCLYAPCIRDSSVAMSWILSLVYALVGLYLSIGATRGFKVPNSDAPR